MKLAAFAAGLVLSGALMPNAHAGVAGPTGSFNSFSFTQQSFNYDGVQTTVVGHLATAVHIRDPEASPTLKDDFFLDLLNTYSGPGTMVATPSSQHVPLAFGNPASCVGLALDDFICTLAFDVSFVGTGNGFGGGVFTSAGTLSFDNASATPPGGIAPQAGGVLAQTSDFFTLPTAAVPEPVSLALFGVGLAGLGLARKRRQS